MTERLTKEGDESIAEMVRRLTGEFDKELANFEEIAEEMAANATTDTPATTAVSATATGGAGRTSAEAAADAKRVSKAEPPPLRHHRN